MGEVGTAVIPSNWARPQTTHPHVTFFRYHAAHAHVLSVHVTMYVAQLQSTRWHLESVDECRHSNC